ncbi:MAG: SAM-dependent methyltransferase [Rikenellaceae bacterium]|nr:SAM-dependent methyltransferase [Rikenellaceae bacterium]
MMTNEQLDILLTDEVRALIEANLERPAAEVALRLGSPHRALIATQIKYLSRARTKLPSYYRSRCILPDLAFEQSSSERAAATKHHSGGLAIDLTCGLGVDSYYLSKRFERVISIERDPVLARLARENFRRLGATNIEVVCASSEEFLTEFEGGADLVYADPDRRSGDGRKLVLLEECSPNVLALKSRLEQIAPRIVLKLSPMFDTSEAERLFAPCVIEAVSDAGECKELVVEFGREVTVGSRRATIASVVSVVVEPTTDGIVREEFRPEEYRYLVASDVALRKTGLAADYMSSRVDFVTSPVGYAFARERVDDPLLKCYEIESMEPFDPKGLRRQLKTEGVRRVDIMKRDFRMPSSELARALGVSEGGSRRVAFTEIGGVRWQILLK